MISILWCFLLPSLAGLTVKAEESDSAHYKVTKVRKLPKVSSIVKSSNIVFPKFPSLPEFPPIPGDGTVTKEQQKFVEDGRKSHNRLRRLHGAPPMKLDDQLTYDSYLWAKKIADECDTAGKFVLRHSHIEDRGENIYAVRGPDHLRNWLGTNETHTRAAEAVLAWYTEISYYNWTTPMYQWKAGHFTQLIWKDSITMGMAWAMGFNGTILVVAQYRPFGNVVDVPGDFERNVLPLRKPEDSAPKKLKFALGSATEQNATLNSET